MKALSIRQPWLWAILRAGKDVENRNWKACNYRGPLLLHAALGGTQGELAEALAEIDQARRDLGLQGVLDPCRPERGGFVGIARIVSVERHPIDFGDIIRAPGAPEVEVAGRRTEGFKRAGHLGLKLADVRPLPFVPAKGALGIYNVEQATALSRVGVLVTGLQGPNFVHFGQHYDAYTAAWADLAAKGGAT